MKLNKIKISLAILILFLVAGAIFYYFSSNKGFSYEFRWKKGYSYIYTLKFRKAGNAMILSSTESGDVSPEQAGGVASMETDIIFNIYDKKDGFYYIGASFKDILHSEHRVSGRDIFKNGGERDAALLKRELLMKIDSSGNIVKFLHKKEESEFFVNIMRLVLSKLQVTISSEYREDAGIIKWKVDDKTPEGVFASQYEIEKITDENISLSKKNEFTKIKAVQFISKKYDVSTDSDFKIILSDEGYIDSINGKEHLSATLSDGKKAYDFSHSVEFVFSELKKIEKKKNLYSDVHNLENVSPDKMTPSKYLKEKLLKNQSMGMTSFEMLETLTNFSRTGEIYKKGLFMWRTIGFLKLHPEECIKLIPLFKKEGGDSESRLLMFGILASTGHKVAQDILMELIKSSEARSDKYYKMFLQNLSFVETPEKGIVAFVEAQYKNAKKSGNLFAPSALTFGAMVKRLGINGQEDEAKKFNDIIVADLLQAKTAKKKENLLDTLGNAAVKENISVVRKFMKDKNDRVRASVANSLRQTQSEDSEKILMKLMEDRSRVVQRQSIQVLQRYKLDKGHIDKVAADIKHGLISSDSYMDALNLLMAYPQYTESVKSSLRIMKKKREPQHSPA